MLSIIEPRWLRRIFYFLLKGHCITSFYLKYNFFAHTCVVDSNMMEYQGTNTPQKVNMSGSRTARTILCACFLAQRKFVHPCCFFLHHSGGRVDLLEQTILGPTWSRIKRGTWRNVKKRMSRKAMPPWKTSRARPPYSLFLKVVERPKRTNVLLHVKRIMAVVLCGSHRGKKLVHMMHHHGSTQVPKRTLYHGDLWELTHFECPRSSFYPYKSIWLFSRTVFLPYSYEEIFSGYEEVVSSIRDGFSAWVKADSDTILGRHSVDVTIKTLSILPRVAPHKDVPNRLIEQTRLSVYKWNPGPRRGKEGDVEMNIVGKYHITTLQEAIEYLEHNQSVEVQLVAVTPTFAAVDATFLHEEFDEVCKVLALKQGDVRQAKLVIRRLELYVAVWGQFCDVKLVSGARQVFESNKLTIGNKVREIDAFQALRPPMKTSDAYRVHKTLPNALLLNS